MDSKSQNALRNLVRTSRLRLSDGARRSKLVLAEFSKQSRNVNHPNFNAVDRNDLESLFMLIDEYFFDGLIRPTLIAEGHALQFRVSHRMTNSGGITTTRFPNQDNSKLDFEIAISSTLLFESFRDPKPILVTGLLCGDRLQAMKRIMEHEMIHLLEMLLWKNSNCNARRFQDIARRLFSHKQSTHQLITPADTAATKFQIEPGDGVYFRAKGHQLFGFVNRITKRATVLVPSKRGVQYNDGKRYDKYYVPVERLRKAA